MTTDDRAALAARHQQSYRYPSYTSADVIHICLNCQVRWPCDTARALALPPDPERLVTAMNAAYTYEDDDNSVPSLPFVDDLDTFWGPFAAAIIAAWEAE